LSKVRLKKIQIQSFRSFVSAEIDFPETGLVLIRGENPETGDPSGSGKSSLLLAIAYVLDILPPEFPATELQSWNSDLPMQVALTLEIDGKLYVFGRGRKTYIKGEDDAEPTTGSKAVAERQKALLGFAPSIVQALTYRAQNTPGLFLNLDPADKSEFLTSVLDLGAIEDAVDKAEKRLSELDVKLTVISGLLAPAKLELDTLAKPSVVLPDMEPIQARHTKVLADIVAQETLIKTATQELFDAIKAETRQQEIDALEAKLVQSRTFLADLRSKDNAESAAMEAKRNVFRSNIRNYDTALAKFEHQLTEKARYESELRKIQEGWCPTCERDWDLANAEPQISALNVKIANLNKEAEGKAVFLARRAEAEAAIADLVFRANPAIEKLVTIEKTLTAEIAVLRAQKDSKTVAAIRARLDSLKTQLGQLKAQELEAKANLRIAENQLHTATELHQQYQTQLAAVTAKIAKHEEAKGQIVADIAVERDFVAMMGREGFLGVIFDDVLREIATEANARIGRLANVSHVSLSFVSESTTQKGKVKKQIQAHVNVGGRATKYKSGLSGGMLTSVEQVVDLGVMAVISRRAGRTLGWLCLDEIFNGQGAMTKESALEVLQEFAQDRLVLVIDHGSEFKEAFTKTITVEQIGGVSRIKGHESPP
jgi:DNA repair exonuclease SbcCD ATPase subunit